MRSSSLLCTIVLLGAACAENGQPSGGVDSLVVAAHSLTLSPQETFPLTAQAFGAQGVLPAGTVVTWRSSDTTIASISDSGIISATAEGNVTLIAKAESESATVALRVVSSFRSVALTEAGQCALRVNGTIWCWGDFFWAAAGEALAGGETYTQLRAGGISANGGSAYCAIRTDQVVECWGTTYGTSILGRGDTTSVGSTGVPGPVLGALDASQIGVGYNQACAVSLSSRGYCWGYDQHGELGTYQFPFDGPDSVGTDLHLTQIAPGLFFNCGLDDGGAAYCWGINTIGQLGVGTPDMGDQNIPQPVVGGQTFVKLEASYWHVCGLTGSGEIWCWGENDDGEGGTGETAFDHTSPTHAAPAYHFLDLAVGDDATCGIADTGLTYCWGAGSQLGAGEIAGAHPDPVLVSGGHTFAHLFSGRGGVCGVTAGGAAYCWGSVLRDGVRVSSTIPVRVTDP